MAAEMTEEGQGGGGQQPQQHQHGDGHPQDIKIA